MVILIYFSSYLFCGHLWVVVLFAAAAVKCTVLVLPQNKTAGKKRKMKKGPFSHGPQGCWLVWAKRQQQSQKSCCLKRGREGA